MLADFLLSLLALEVFLFGTAMSTPPRLYKWMFFYVNYCSIYFETENVNHFFRLSDDFRRLFGRFFFYYDRAMNKVVIPVQILLCYKCVELRCQDIFLYPRQKCGGLFSCFFGIV